MTTRPTIFSGHIGRGTNLARAFTSQHRCRRRELCVSPLPPHTAPRQFCTMSVVADAFPSVVVLSTSIVSFMSGFVLGIYSIRGYLVSPALSERRRRNQADPVESEESEIDEEDSLLDHAPNWSNSEAADRRQGLRVSSAGAQAKLPAEKKEGAERAAIADSNEECKLVLVVRTDLGMTKGMELSQARMALYAYSLCFPSARLRRC